MDLCLVGYTYRNYTMEEAFQRAARFGYKYMEIRDFADMEWDTPQGMERAVYTAKALSNLYPVRPLAYFKPIHVSEVDKEPSDSFQRLMMHLGALHYPIFHTQVILEGRTSSREMDGQDVLKVVDILQKMGSIGERFGLVIAVETHMGTIHDTFQSALEIIRLVNRENVRLSMDFANLLISNPREDIVKAVREGAPLTGYVHLKNVRILGNGYDWGIPMEMGDIDYYLVLRELVRHYKGPLAVEYCGSGDPSIFAERDSVYLKRLLQEIEG